MVDYSSKLRINNRPWGWSTAIVSNTLAAPASVRLPTNVFHNISRPGHLVLLFSHEASLDTDLAQNIKAHKGPICGKAAICTISKYHFNGIPTISNW
jgi:hypothetical protein